MFSESFGILGKQILLFKQYISIFIVVPNVAKLSKWKEKQKRNVILTLFDRLSIALLCAQPKDFVLLLLGHVATLPRGFLTIVRSMEFF